MKVSVFGLGYVGTVTSACLAHSGHHVLGVDVATDKVRAIQNGLSPIVEPGVAELIARTVTTGNLRATGDAVSAVVQTDLSLVCVGTPSGPNGALDLSGMARACTEIGKAIRTKTTSHHVVVRSTMLPGSTRRCVIPSLEQGLGHSCGARCTVAVNPEFMREANAVEDFFHPPKIVIGADSPDVATLVASLYSDIEAPRVLTAIETAEMVKYVDNSFHALKVTFANEIGLICKNRGIDGSEVMRIFCLDRKLNISDTYFKPGFAFGGSCLPKDLRALTHLAREKGISVPMLCALLPSNDAQIMNAAMLVSARRPRRVAVLGFAFKSGTDDVRESPVLRLSMRLLEDGHDLSFYDEYVDVSRLCGANRDYATVAAPDIASRVVSSPAVAVEEADVVLIGTMNERIREVLKTLRPEQHVIDLTPCNKPPTTPASYERVSG